MSIMRETGKGYEKLLSSPKGKKIMELLAIGTEYYNFDTGLVEFKNKHTHKEIAKLVPCSTSTISKVRRAIRYFNTINQLTYGCITSTSSL